MTLEWKKNAWLDINIKYVCVTLWKLLNYPIATYTPMKQGNKVMRIKHYNYGIITKLFNYYICHFCSHILKVIVKITQLCLTLWDPMDYTVHGILQAKILEWVAVPFSRGSSQPRDQAQVSCTAGGFFTSWTTGRPLTLILQVIWLFLKKNQSIDDYWQQWKVLKV